MSVEVEIIEEPESFEVIRAHREAVSRVGEERNDRLGATARVLVALADDERPTDADLIAAGLPTPGQMDTGAE